MLKEFLLRKMLKSQLKGVPADQQEKLFKAFEANPKLFETIAKEVQAKVKEGKNQQAATLEVAQKYRKELSQAFK